MTNPNLRRLKQFAALSLLSLLKLFQLHILLTTKNYHYSFHDFTEGQDSHFSFSLTRNFPSYFWQHFESLALIYLS